MREILFRAKRTDNGEWVEGYFVKGKWYLDEKEKYAILPIDLCFYPHCEINEWIEIDPETVRQYTGLTDKNGEKVFVAVQQADAKKTKKKPQKHGTGGQKMSDDLISRKALLEEIRSFRCSITGLRAGKGVLASAADEYRKSILQIIEDQPTAFDKEKVTQELKSNMESAQLAQSLVGTDLVQCGGFSYGYYNGVKDAVKIVEKGGIKH